MPAQFFGIKNKMEINALKRLRKEDLVANLLTANRERGELAEQRWGAGAIGLVAGILLGMALGTM